MASSAAPPFLTIIRNETTVLAQCRANGDTALLSLSQQAGISRGRGLSCLPGLINNEEDGSTLETSQDSVLSVSVLSTHSNLPGTPPSKRTHGLMLLRSPGPED
ncbi:hypothetical protein CesoFtcFv8_022043 [Champsocephalus esox]|uniref:Uncharacterized protein n=1 Tax=Champsocephalus esox TaxID=159716 RepID=A0AAN8BB23_9TELE|nr:hypothetical protein CesoFtcFv8_022043 [Champsocephalus esox]